MRTRAKFRSNKNSFDCAKETPINHRTTRALHTVPSFSNEPNVTLIYSF